MRTLLILFLWMSFLCTACENKAGSGALVGAGSGETTGIVIPGRGSDLSRGGVIVNVSLSVADRAALEKYPQTLHKLEKGEPLSIEDIKKMSKAGLSDSVIIDQIDATHSAFYLNTSDIISLKKAKVSQRVIDYMIQSGNR